jgi:hypothetical protein
MWEGWSGLKVHGLQARLLLRTPVPAETLEEAQEDL